MALVIRYRNCFPVWDGDSNVNKLIHSLRQKQGGLKYYIFYFIFYVRMRIAEYFFNTYQTYLKKLLHKLET